MPDSDSATGKRTRQGHHAVKSVGAAAPASAPAPVAKETTQPKSPQKKLAPVKKMTAKKPMKNACLAVLSAAPMTALASEYVVMPLASQIAISVFYKRAYAGCC
jgi:hypothetical protein